MVLFDTIVAQDNYACQIFMTWLIAQESPLLSWVMVDQAGQPDKTRDIFAYFQTQILSWPFVYYAEEV